MCEMEADVKVTNLLPFSGRLYFAEAAGEAALAAFAFFILCALAGLAEAGAAAEAEATAAAEATGAEAAGADAFDADAAF